MSYPKWLFSKNGNVLLKNEEEENALVGKWFDSPAKVIFKKIEKEPEEEVLLTDEEAESRHVQVTERLELLAEAERNGIEVDRRWGLKRLQDAVANK